MQPLSLLPTSDLSSSPNGEISPLQSQERLRALYSTHLLVTLPVKDFDRLTAMARRLLNAPVALVSLVDANRQFFKSTQGLTEPWTTQRGTPLSHSFCQYVVTSGAPLIVEDARAHPVLCHNLAIPDLQVVAYMGVPLRTPEGQNLGSLCVMEDKPRSWSSEDLQTLSELAELVMTEITVRQYLFQQQEIQEELEKSNALLRGVIQGSSDGIYVRDLEGRYLLVNEFGAAMVGFTPQEMIGKKYSELFSAKIVAEIEEEDTKTLRSGATSQREQSRKIDGVLKTFHSTRSPYRDVHGQVNGVLSFIHDISEIKETEAALRASEENFRSLFESMTQGVVYQNAEGNIISANAAAQSILGLTLEELQGRRSIDPRWRAIRADGSEFPGDEHPAMRALHTGEVQRNVLMYISNPQLEELRCLRVDAIPQFREGDKRPYQVYVLFRDITEQRRNNEKLNYHAQLLSNMYDAVIATDNKFNITVWNRGAEQMYGWKAEEVLGQPVREVVHTTIHDTVRQQAIQELQTTGRYRMESITLHKDGAPIPTESITVTLVDPEGVITAYLSINRNISERKQTEKALQDSVALVQQQLAEIETLYATTPIGLAVVDRDLRYVRINEYLAANNGYTVAEHMGRTGSELIPNVANQLNELMREIMTSGKPQVNIEVAGTTPSQPSLERTWQESFYPLHNATGEIIGLNIVVQDITDRKQAEAALQESEERFRVTFEQAPVGIAHSNLGGNYIRVNNRLCEMLGYTRAELLQKDLHSITHPDDEVASHQQMQRLLVENSQSYTLEKRYLHKNGTYFWVNVTVSVVRNLKTHAPEYFIRVVEDISERKRYEQELEEVNATLEQRVAIRSRQLEMSNSKLLESQTKLRLLSQQLMQMTEQERKRISREIHDQLGQSLTAIKMEVKGAQRRITSDPAGVATRLHTVDQLIDETVDTVRRIAADLRPGVLDHFGLGPAVEWQMEQFKQRNHIDYELEIDVDPKAITPDMATAAFRILQEALTNVVRHAQASQVTITLTTEPDEFTMKVRDNGRGIGDVNPQRQSLGVLGMSERAQQLGGNVILSGAQGGGAEVTLTLPLNVAGNYSAS